MPADAARLLGPAAFALALVLVPSADGVASGEERLRAGAAAVTLLGSLGGSGR